jgi:hypothetical protein
MQSALDEVRGAIWGEQTLLAALKRPVDFILASHVVEHVPDLITWLNELRSALTEQGEVRLAVPDRRFTFDFLRRETELSDVLAAYLLAPRVPQPREILDYFLNATVVDTEAAWRGEVSVETLQRPNTFEPAMAKARDSIGNSTYHDAHCWVFTPHTFAILLGQLAKHHLIHFACEQFHDTEQHSIEFFVVLRNSGDVARNVASWRAMEDATRPKSPEDLTEPLRATKEALEKSREEVKLLRDMQDALERSREEVRLLRDTQLALDKSREEVRLLRQSSSWRVTAPLRRLSIKVRSLKR